MIRQSILQHNSELHPEQLMPAKVTQEVTWLDVKEQIQKDKTLQMLKMHLGHNGSPSKNYMKTLDMDFRLQSEDDDSLLDSILGTESVLASLLFGQQGRQDVSLMVALSRAITSFGTVSSHTQAWNNFIKTSLENDKSTKGDFRDITDTEDHLQALNFFYKSALAAFENAYSEAEAFLKTPQADVTYTGEVYHLDAAADVA